MNSLTFDEDVPKLYDFESVEESFLLLLLKRSLHRSSTFTPKKVGVRITKKSVFWALHGCTILYNRF